MDCTALTRGHPALWSYSPVSQVPGVSSDQMPLSRRACFQSPKNTARYALGRGETRVVDAQTNGGFNAGRCTSALLHARSSDVVSTSLNAVKLQRSIQVRGRRLGFDSHERTEGTAHNMRRKRKQRRHDCTAMGGQVNQEYVELPLFPLPLVLFPGAVLPLQIFEYRYRIMMHTLLETDLRFGVLYTGKDAGSASAIGCVGEIIKHERLVDDRFFLVCRGQERFRVVSIVRTKPYLVGRVEWLEDKPSPEPEDLDTLASEVERLMKDVIRLSNKMTGKGEKDVADDLRKRAFPTPFSFWVASTFEGASMEQQSLLELEDTAERLRRERDTLKNTLNYLTAATAVKDAFSD